MKTGIAVFAHGSRIEAANEAVRAVAAELARVGGYGLVEPAFLELGYPDLAGAIAKLVERGASRIVVVPYFLTLGLHLERDLPELVRDAACRFDSVAIETTLPLDGHPALAGILLDRVREALEGV